MEPILESLHTKLHPHQQASIGDQSGRLVEWRAFLSELNEAHDHGFDHERLTKTKSGKLKSFSFFLF